MAPPSSRKSACLLDNKLLHQGIQCIQVICQGGARLCLNLQCTHLRRVLADDGVVALKVVVLGLQQQPQMGAAQDCIMRTTEWLPEGSHAGPALAATESRDLPDAALLRSTAFDEGIAQ